LRSEIGPPQTKKKKNLRGGEKAKNNWARGKGTEELWICPLLRKKKAPPFFFGEEERTKEGGDRKGGGGGGTNGVRTEKKVSRSDSGFFRGVPFAQRRRPCARRKKRGRGETGSQKKGGNRFLEGREIESGGKGKRSSSGEEKDKKERG